MLTYLILMLNKAETLQNHLKVILVGATINAGFIHEIGVFCLWVAQWVKFK